MTHPTVVLAAATLLVLSGCSGLPGTGTQTPAPTESPTDPLVRSGPGEYAHDIYVANQLEADVTMTVTVERNGTELFRNATTVAAGADATVAGFTATTLPEDDRTVTVSATDDRGGSASVQVSISGCLGDVEFFYDDGTLDGTYSIC